MELPRPPMTGDLVQSNRISLPELATIVAVVAIIYFAKDVFLPLATAMLVTFALSPLASRLRKLGLPHLPSVLLVVATTFTVVGLFILIVAAQLGVLAQNLPTFQANIITKVENLREASSENSIVVKLTSMITAINQEIGSAVPAPVSSGTITELAVQAPMPVEVIENQSPLATLQDLVVPLISPIATIGLVIVVVIFMLLEREDLRDRFIMLVGSNDLYRTTQVLQDAGQRVAQYLLVQLLVNVIYAIPIGIGLWLIGVPNALLWGLLTLVLRFVPYIGSMLAAAFPLFLAFAVAPGWSAVIWTILLFSTVELITSNAIEPYLYGSRTGVSPLAIIVSAIFWTWLWGPLGLVMSTPLTVCLVVLGRHIPQFELFDILFGDDPILAPHARLYQRLLVGDGLEATIRAEESLETQFLSEYYRDVGIPALLIAQSDHQRGVLTTDQQRRLALAAMAMVGDLSGIVAEELAEMQGTVAGPGAENAEGLKIDDLLPGGGYRVMCIGGRSDLDDAAAAMLAQTLAAEGAKSDFRLHSDLAPSRSQALAATERDCVILVFLDASPSRASLLHVQRIKRAAPQVRVGVLICEMPKDDDTSPDMMTIRIRSVDPDILQAAHDIGADFVVTTIKAVMLATFVPDPPKPLALPKKRLLRGRTTPKSVATGTAQVPVR